MRPEQMPVTDQDLQKRSFEIVERHILCTTYHGTFRLNVTQEDIDRQIENVDAVVHPYQSLDLRKSGIEQKADALLNFLESHFSGDLTNLPYRYIICFLFKI